MLTAALLVVILLVPGYLVSRLAGGREYLYLQSVSLSYLLFIALVALARTLEWSVNSLAVTYLVLSMFLLMVLIATTLLRKPAHSTNSEITTTLFSSTLSPWTVTGVCAGAALYFMWFGVYDEVPSDLYQHLDYANDAFQRMDIYGFGEGSGIYAGFGRGHRAWYVLVSWTALFFDAGLAETYSSVIVANTVLFLVGVAVVADRIFRVFGFSRKEHQVAVLATVVFLFAQMGLSAISYVRYYSYAPTMLNYIAYFAALVCLLNLYERKDSDIRSLAFLVAAMAVTAVIHVQEFVFIAVALFLLGTWWALKEARAGFRAKEKVPVRVFALLFVLVCGALGLYLWIRMNHNVRPFTHTQVLQFSLRYIGNLYILDPAYRFYLVITTWGIAVYLLFLVFFRRFTCQPFLLLGMFSPLVTVFNPLFADIFVRLGESGTLWRLSLFVPLHFVAGALVIFLFRQVGKRIDFRAGISAVGLLSLVLFLVPSVASVTVNAHAKTTLQKVAPSNSWRHWQDLVEFLVENDFDTLGVKKRILVDPVTAYVIDALTRYNSYNYKFLPSKTYYRRPFAFENYDDFPLSIYSNQLIVVNARDGGPSLAGEISGHWHRDILRVSDYYPDGLLPHLEENPDRFEKLWSADRISVYRIR
jgi:hypothetical protein